MHCQGFLIFFIFLEKSKKNRSITFKKIFSIIVHTYLFSLIYTGYLRDRILINLKSSFLPVIRYLNYQLIFFGKKYARTFPLENRHLFPSVRIKPNCLQ